MSFGKGDQQFGLFCSGQKLPPFWDLLWFARALALPVPPPGTRMYHDTFTYIERVST
jgi:hypothetical protein